jgi:glucose-6-phosphate isomerase
LTNANAARQWIVQSLGAGAVTSHFAAVSSSRGGMDGFGIGARRRFGMWDWVGGRYSLWSAVGLSLALVIGMDTFRGLLAGGRLMDQHFRQAPMDENMPVTLALLGVWYNNFFGAQTQAILPYDNRLDRFPAYLQQLQMESSGKDVRMDGKPVRCDTGMVIWGESGSNAQHSFYQLLHQGTRLVPVDFLLSAKTSGGTQVQHNLAVANCLAQSEALMEGDHPSNTIVFEKLTPEVLGQLIALYEHKVFVEGVIWGIDSFDQWGVELGKKLVDGINKSENPSTRFLLDCLSKKHV